MLPEINIYPIGMGIISRVHRRRSIMVGLIMRGFVVMWLGVINRTVIRSIVLIMDVTMAITVPIMGRWWGIMSRLIMPGVFAVLMAIIVITRRRGCGNAHQYKHCTDRCQNSGCTQTGMFWDDGFHIKLLSVKLEITPGQRSDPILFGRCERAISRL